MKFDTTRFLTDYNIQFWTSGENVSRNRVGVTCPFCDDTYNHLGLHITGARKPTCWKCGSHSLYDYINAVTGENPKEILQRYLDIHAIDLVQFEPEKQYATVCIPPGSKNFRNVHRKYLSDRGFDPDWLIHKYDLTVTSPMDEYPYRIIFPIKYRKKTVSYQGRSFTGAIPKYLTCKPENEVMFHKDIFFNIDNAKNDSVIITEGVFDAVRLGDNAIASFGTSITPSQLNLIKSRYKRVFMLYDGEDEAQKKAKKACLTLSAFGIEVENIKLHDGDPGELSEDDALHLLNELHLL